MYGLNTHFGLEFGRPPSIVLVARSARDGYTPPELVDAIQVRAALNLFLCLCLCLCLHPIHHLYYTCLHTCVCIDRQERLLVGLEGVPELMAGSGGKSGLKVSKHYEEEEEEEGVEEGQGEK